MDLVIRTIAIGIIATIAIDIWATFANKMLMWPRTNWAMVGRWVGHIPQGRFTHEHIGSAQPIKHESAIGWGFHYLIGMLYALLYFAYVFIALNGVPTFVSALVFGMATILSPWFLMQPGLGLGICASKAPQPNLVRLNNICIHSLFGMALYFGWLLVNAYS